MSDTTRAVVLLSGGMDSATAATQAVDDYDQVFGIAFDYGSLHGHQEIQAAHRVAARLGIPLHLVKLGPIFAGYGSALIPSDDVAMPHHTYEQLAAAEGPSPTYVPFRNGVMLAVAVAHAMTLSAGVVIGGMHAEDAHNFAYPDCTPEFTGAIAAAAYVGTYHQVRLRFPFQHMTKAEIARLGVAIDAPLAVTWSCYDPVIEYTGNDDDGTVVPCGKCPTCISRQHAFAEAGVPDPAASRV